MVANREQEEELREVKAVLQNLSRIGADRIPAGGSSGKTANSLAPLESRASALPTPAQKAGRGAAHGRAGRRKQLWAFALAATAGGVLVLGADSLIKRWPAPSADSSTGPAGPVDSPLPPSASENPAGAALPSAPPLASWSFAPAAHNPAGASPANAAPTAPNPAVASAKQMMDSGKVLAARRLLQQPSLTSSQDAAWLLARSYDPNYLAALKSPDAASDKDKAAEWYRRWRDIGAQNGVQIDDARLKRLIETSD